jgi:twitching motility protein PilJ
VSNQIASLVHNISASARSQSQSSQSVARNMQVLREISSQTADTTNSTSDAIGKLAQLSAALRKSVSGFRLPDASSTASTGQHRVPVAPDPEVATTGTFRRVSGELNG